MSIASRSQPIIICQAHSLNTIPIPQVPIRDHRIAGFRHFLSKAYWINAPIAMKIYTSTVNNGFDQFHKAVKNPISNSSRNPIHLPHNLSKYVSKSSLYEYAALKESIMF